MCSEDRATILITGGKYVRMYRRGREEDKMDAVIEKTNDFHTGGPYNTYEFPTEIQTSDKEAYVLGITKMLLTESGKNVSVEDLLADLVATFIPEVEPMTKKELSLIIERSKRIGAIDEHLDSLGENIGKLKVSFDKRLETLKMIQART